MAYLFLTLLRFFFLAPLGQQTGQGSAPRYLCPRLQVFQPPRFAFDIATLLFHRPTIAAERIACYRFSVRRADPAALRRTEVEESAAPRVKDASFFRQLKSAFVIQYKFLHL